MQLRTLFFLLFSPFFFTTPFFSADYYEAPNQAVACMAAENGDVHMLNCLIKNGLTCNLFIGSTEQPLCIVAQNFYKIFNSYCMHCKILQHACTNPACQKKYYECLELLCKQKWPVNAQDKWHNTALHHLIYTLIYSFHTKTDYLTLFFSIKLLLMHNARVDIKNDDKTTVLELVQHIPQEYTYKKDIVTLVTTRNAIFLATPIIFD